MLASMPDWTLNGRQSGPIFRIINGQRSNECASWSCTVRGRLDLLAGVNVSARKAILTATTRTSNAYYVAYGS